MGIELSLRPPFPFPRVSCFCFPDIWSRSPPPSKRARSKSKVRELGGNSNGSVGVMLESFQLNWAMKKNKKNAVFVGHFCL